jgi:hypothetical protein
MPRGRPRKNSDDALMKSAEFIGWALGGIEREIVQTRHRLAALTAQAATLRKKIGGRAAAAVDTSGADEAAQGGRKRKRRSMSPEARKRISEMMKKRWAERRKK